MGDQETIKEKGVIIIEKFEKTFLKGELLFKQGDPPDEVYLVKSGKIEVFVNEGENKKRLNIVTEGEFLGEMAIIDGRPRSASAAALEDSTVIIIDRKTLLKQMEVDPLLGALITTLVRRLREMDRKLSRT
ncbi:MAG: cyclic nucleotide-binding domain-containing protein [bacterium]|uniref:Cyclic nucleotide-binding protein n=2 Tax=Bacteria candidate phyla TaxID=1783234 RepID=A0A101I087_UNCT6|nr:MAG: Cyclic nucleotide-binding protein [candidate division TA06 bacterium 32_111]KUK86642.1 MAG: Cyclic nucleotide-binding protein [candidate division TA06 bacterium 34_109]MDI6699892.1 cyclic nucleotide-binding domain-containing protein [bacterium]HAF07407.1 hypothetical protein [candidate division WOR-3 bacterium]HCP17183.1 hypothetical protein [candidate division WOR-3 bacterium]